MRLALTVAFLSSLSILSSAQANPLDDQHAAVIRVYRSGNLKAAEQLALETVKACADNPAQLKTAKRNLAVIYRAQDRNEEAEALERETADQTASTIVPNERKQQPEYKPKAKDKFTPLLPVDVAKTFSKSLLSRLLRDADASAREDFPSVSAQFQGVDGFRDGAGNKYLHFKYVLGHSVGLMEKPITYIYRFDPRGKMLGQSLSEGILTTTQKHSQIQSSMRKQEIEDERKRQALSDWLRLEEEKSRNSR